jgi:hypothetical protein
MVEYGQVSGGVGGGAAGGGSNPFQSGPTDLGARVSNAIGDTVETVMALPIGGQLLLLLAVVVGLVILRRAF